MQCNVEIQLQPQQYENERILYYWSDNYIRQLKRGDIFGELKKTISIVILDHEIEALREMEKLGVKWQIRDDQSGKKVLTDRLEISIIELPKAKRIYEKDKKNRIGQWMMFLDNPNKEEVVQIMGENEHIRKAIDELEQVSGDEKLRRIAELREKAIRDEQAAMAYAKEHGYNEGYEEGKKEGLETGLKEGRKEGREEGREEGKKEGREEGIEAGREEGKKQKQLEIVKKLLQKDMKIEEIEEITGLSIEKIKEIKFC